MGKQINKIRNRKFFIINRKDNKFMLINVPKKYRKKRLYKKLYKKYKEKYENK